MSKLVFISITICFAYLVQFTLCQNGGSKAFWPSTINNGKKHFTPWIPVTLDQALSIGLTKAGVEEGVNLYNCRAKIEDKDTPGKVWTYRSSNIVECHVPYQGANIRKGAPFEILLPMGSTKWVQPSNSSLPRNAIAGGIDIDDTTLYLCRAFIDEGIIPGKYHVPNQKCYYGRNGLEWNTEMNFEILVEDF